MVTIMPASGNFTYLLPLQRTMPLTQSIRLLAMSVTS